MLKLKKILISIMTFILTSSVLYPAYRQIGQNGILISLTIGALLGAATYLIFKAVENESSAKEDKIKAYLNDMNKSSLDIIKELKYIINSIKNIEAKEEKTALTFAEKSSSILDLIKEDINEVNKFKTEILERQEFTLDSMQAANHHNKKLFNQVTEELSNFTASITELFEGRVDNEYKAINETRADISESLLEIRKLLAKAEESNASHIGMLEEKYEELFVLYNSTQKNFHQKLTEQIEKLQGILSDNLEGTSNEVKGILKKQCRNSDNIISDIKDIQNNISEQIKAQSEKYSVQLEEFKSLREELMKLNSVDIELIGRMLNGK
jgi:gas vesicle protein